MPHVTLPPVGTDRAWRDAARALLTARVAPENVTWSRGDDEGDLFRDGAGPPPAQPGKVGVPESFIHLAGQVVWHSDPERFTRLYALVWRLRADRRLMMADHADAEVARLRAMEKTVHRDIHKLHAFVRFREVGDRAAPRRAFAAWFEPGHFTLEPAAPFFARRFADMDWRIATPDLVAAWDGQAVTFEAGAPRPDLPEDAAEELWVTYFRNIFNPARVKVKAMTSEMPRKYWKNLPEAAAIPDLLAGAEARVRDMAAARPTEAPAFAKALAARPAPGGAPPPEPGTLGELARDEAACTRCDLHRAATRVVPGEGPPDAPLLMVGEQPGDQEDLAGRPFVGPAGQLFDQLMDRAGIDRSTVFLTNAVKHFKYSIKGRRRIHQSPNGGEIAACRWWVAQEIALVRPKLLVALGASAAESLTGTRKDILKRRGRIEEGREGLPVFLTVHPSFLLRLPDRAMQESETARFVEDLVAVKAEIERLVGA